MSEFRRAKSRIQLSPGESVRIMRELQELSQEEPDEAKRTALTQDQITTPSPTAVECRVKRQVVVAL